jgi:hypothetical protein
METLGTADPDFLDWFVEQLAIAATKERGMNERGPNFMLSVVKGLDVRAMRKTAARAGCLRRGGCARQPFIPPRP